MFITFNYSSKLHHILLQSQDVIPYQVHLRNPLKCGPCKKIIAQDRAIITVSIKDSNFLNTLSFSSSTRGGVLVDQIKPNNPGSKQLLEFIVILCMTLTELLRTKKYLKNYVIQLLYLYRRKYWDREKLLAISWVRSHYRQSRGWKSYLLKATSQYFPPFWKLFFHITFICSSPVKGSLWGSIKQQLSLLLLKLSLIYMPYTLIKPMWSGSVVKVVVWESKDSIFLPSFASE